MNVLSKAANAVLLHAGSALGACFRVDYKNKAHHGRRFSEKALMKIVKANRDTEYGKKYGFADIHSVEDYQRAVPLSDYDDYRPYVNRMVKNGEKKLLTARRIGYFATTSGTTGETKLIPEIVSSYTPFFKMVCLLVNDVTTAIRETGVPGISARGLLTTEVHIKPMEKSGMGGHGRSRVGAISSYAAGGMKLFLPIFTPFPKEAFDDEIRDLRYVKARCALQDPGLKWFGGPFMSALSDIMCYIEGNLDMLLHDIEPGTIDSSVEMGEAVRKKLEARLRPDPKRAAELREIFAQPSDAGLISKIWKNMCYVAAIGAGDFAPFTKKMRAWCGDRVRFAFAVYAASEALFGYAMRMGDPSYLLLMDGNFYEFLPVEDSRADRERPLQMHELEVGKKYEIVVTNRSGLYRYCIRDVVKVVGFEGETPYLEFAYRANRVTDLCGSHITDEFIAAAVEAVEQEMGFRIEDYSLYADSEHIPPRVVMFMEPERPVDEGERLRMRDAFEAGLIRASRGYRLAREAENLCVCELHAVEKGTYMRYRRKKIAAGASENQLKSIRVIKPGEELAFFLAAVAEPAVTIPEEES